MASEKPEDVMDDGESIKVRYEGKTPIRADIVSVHGLTGNGLGAWEKKDTRDLLPKAVPCGESDHMESCDSSTRRGQNTILKHAKNFLLDLAGERAEEDGIEPDHPKVSSLFGTQSGRG